MDQLQYDKTDPESIESYAKTLVGHTFLDVLKKDSDSAIMAREDVFEYGNAKRKGGLGNLLEERFFGYKANSESEPDFPEAGVELKATPYELTQKGDYRAGERLVLSMINYAGPISSNLYTSHVWHKCRLLLLIYYLRDKSLNSNLLYQINYVSLFTPTKADLAIIENDYKIIADKIMAGRADELSEADTFYLGACTKGQTAATSIVPQFYPPHRPAKRRAFCYKNSYMTVVLNEYIIKGVRTYEPIIKDTSELAGKTFDQYVIEQINKHIGQTDAQLCELYGREYNDNKAQWTDLAYRMLGIRSNRAEEFRKANIVVKVIRVEENGSIRESMSFPPFKYKELVEEEWESSTLHDYFDETKFLFVVFRRSGDHYVLKGCKFWNMPYSDLNSIVREGWERVVRTIKRGIEFTFKDTKAGVVIENDLPKKKDNPIIHVRPHASKRYYEFANGTVIGDGNRSYANQLPDGTWMTNYSFWINNDYILKQIDTILV